MRINIIKTMKKILITLFLLSSLFGAEVWRSELRIRCAGIYNVLHFGANDASGDTFDPGIDVPFFPPPSGGYGYFPLNDPSHSYITKLSSDFRAPSADTIFWNIFVEGGFGFIFKWNRSFLPDSGLYKIGLFCPDSLPNLIVLDWTDMRASDSLILDFIGGMILAVGSPLSFIDEVEKPTKAMIDVFPNPFNSSVRISVDYPKEGHRQSPLQIEIFDINGRMIRRFDGSRDQGKTKIIWQPEDGIPSGVYLICAKNKDGIIMEKRAVYLK